MAATAIAKPVETILIDRFIVVLPSTLKVRHYREQ
jgi:hypothetical protein